VNGVSAVTAAVEAIEAGGERATEETRWLVGPDQAIGDIAHESPASAANAALKQFQQWIGKVAVVLKDFWTESSAVTRSRRAIAATAPTSRAVRYASAIDADVARELSNSLTVIAGNIRLALNAGGIDESARARLVVAGTAARRALNLAVGLLPDTACLLDGRFLSEDAAGTTTATGDGR